MLLKRRTESTELLGLRYLNTRMDLPTKDKFHYLNLEKGYEGERRFDLLIEGLAEERYIINDLLLEVNNSYFQIDTMIISQEAIHLLEIKNYQGDFYLESDKLYAVANNREYKNPIDQLKRSTALLHQLLRDLKLSYPIESVAIFNNPEFTLYQAPMNYPIILPTQLNRFLKDLNGNPSKLNDGHKKLAQKLISLHKNHNPFTVLPNYSYGQLQPGVYCKNCFSFLISVENNKLVCNHCGCHEEIAPAVLRNVEGV
ncbi:nuclease-related domain-containing protein [Mesobacillus maritimus]|uniref:nuclease-related domain-containing protein n=1 Tax=Mesobacillus maritimus TaxID=1643336 RepID=UPI0031BABCAD